MLMPECEWLLRPGCDAETLARVLDSLAAGATDITQCAARGATAARLVSLLADCALAVLPRPSQLFGTVGTGGSGTESAALAQRAAEVLAGLCVCPTSNDSYLGSDSCGTAPN